MSDIHIILFHFLETLMMNALQSASSNIASSGKKFFSLHSIQALHKRRSKKVSVVDVNETLLMTMLVSAPPAPMIECGKKNYS